jgi:type IV secretion system protein VirD4
MSPSPNPNGGNVTATKILWGQILIVFVNGSPPSGSRRKGRLGGSGSSRSLVLLGSSLREGRSMFPVTSFWWWYHYDAHAPRIFLEGAGIAVSGGFAAIGIAIVMSVWRAREAKTITTYGSARWATKREIRAAGLLGSDGVVLGRFGRDYLRHDGPEHVLCVAPTRSGKGVGLSSRHS